MKRQISKIMINGEEVPAAVNVKIDFGIDCPPAPLSIDTSKITNHIECETDVIVDLITPPKCVQRVRLILTPIPWPRRVWLWIKRYFVKGK